MLDMKNFEGIKKINNVAKLEIQDIYKLLLEYEKQIGGTVKLKENEKILADVDGKYEIEIYLSGKYIVVQRRIEEKFEEETIVLGTDLKSVDMAKADRMVDQIYDLLNTLSEDGTVLEPITGVKKVLFINQNEGKLRNHFYITNEVDEKVYEIRENKLLKEFIVNNLISKRKDISIQYPNAELGKYTIVKSPYNIITFQRKDDEIKTVFIAKLNSKEILVKADYSNNHYAVEFNNIVIGAIDSLNDKTKDSYRIEINDLEYEYLIVCLTIIIDMNI